MYFAVSGSDLARRSRMISDFAAGPDAVSIAAYAAATWLSDGETAGSGAWPAPDRTSATAIPRSDERS